MRLIIMTTEFSKKDKNPVEGLEIIVEKTTKITKESFFKILARSEDGLTLTIVNVSHFFNSKYDIGKQGCFIDYSFTKDSKNYEIGIYYNLGKSTPEGEVILNRKMNIFLILAIVTNLTEADTIKVSENFVNKTLTGIKFKAEIGTAYNGGFLIKPMKLLED